MYLLDTHIWLWMLDDSDRLRPRMRGIIEDGGNTLLLSAASVWEIAIKQRSGKLRLPESTEAYVQDRIRVTDVTPLDITSSHAFRAASLPAHHGDPFDRMLIAQARSLGVPIITVDGKFRDYEVDLVDD